MTATTVTAPQQPEAGPSRHPHDNPDSWAPSRYLEPNHPDNEEVLEQAAYQAAVTRPLGDSRGNRKYKPRRTVDYMGGVQKWRTMTKMRGARYMPPIHPNPSDIINLLPPAALVNNPSTSICDYFVHTSINKERSPTRVVKWTPDARRLLTGNDKGQFTLWNGASFNYESITQVHDDSIRHMAYSHNGQALVSTDKSGWIKYFTPHLTNIHGFQGHREACHGVAWSPNDERFVTGGDDGLVKIWNYRAASAERELSGHGWDVRCVDWHPTKGLVVSGSKDMLVKFWDPRTGKDLSTLHSHKAVINACQWSPEGHIVATAGGDGLIRLFDIRTFRELEALKGHTKEINCLEWHPIHHSILASGDAAGAIAYWSLLAPDMSKPVTMMEAAHDDAVFSLSFHPLGHILCSGSKDFTARFWSRARPTGGHEIDRYHLGEEGAYRAEKEREEAQPRPNLHTRDDEVSGALPGLPGLTGANTAGRWPLAAGGPAPGLPGIGGGGGAPPTGLPGLGGGGGGGHGPGPARGNAPTPPIPHPQRRWGQGGGGGGGGGGDDMMRPPPGTGGFGGGGAAGGGGAGGGGGGGAGGGGRWQRPQAPPPGGAYPNANAQRGGAGGGYGQNGGQQGGYGGQGTGTSGQGQGGGGGGGGYGGRGGYGQQQGGQQGGYGGQGGGQQGGYGQGQGQGGQQGGYGGQQQGQGGYGQSGQGGQQGGYGGGQQGGYGGNRGGGGGGGGYGRR